jgi:putative endonuclease
MFYVYILLSTSSGKYYVGQTSDLKTRLESHNKGESKFTSAYIPWEIKWFIEIGSRKEALILEKKLKNLAGKRLIEFLEKHNSS